MKRSFGLLLVFALLLLQAPATAIAQAAPTPQVVVNGAALALPADQQPVIENGLTLIPMRAIFEALGAAIAWDAETSTVTGTKGSTTVQITLDAAEATVNGKAVALAKPARLIGSRTYVPLRFVSEALGARVGWDGETATIRITDKQPAVGGSASLPATRIQLSLLEQGAGSPDRMLRAVYGDGLLRYQPGNLMPEPALAAAMPTTSENGTTYTFRLRKGVTFHDGTEVTANDFIFTLGLVTRANQGWPISSGSASVLTSLWAPDPYTLVLTTREPLAPHILRLATIPPLPSHLLANVPIRSLPTHSFWQAPVGAGAFRVESATASELVLKRNPQFWEAKVNPEVGPWLEELRFHAAQSEEDRTSLLMAGDLDLFDGLLPPELARMGIRPMAAYNYVRNGHGYFTFNTQVFPTNDVRVRQALSLAFDRTSIVENLMGGAAIVPAGPLMPFHWAADPAAAAPAPDTARAVELLKQAGFTRNAQGMFEKDGVPLTVRLYLSAGSSLLEGLAYEARQSWEKIGVKTDVAFLDFNNMVDNYLKPGRFHVTFSGFSMAPDPYGYFADLWSTSAIRLDTRGNASGFNRGRYSNPEFDALVVQMRQTVDLAEQRTLFQKAAAILNADAPAIWVYSNQYTDYVSRRLQGVVVRNGYGVVYPEYWYETVTQ